VSRENGGFSKWPSIAPTDRDQRQKDQLRKMHSAFTGKQRGTGERLYISRGRQRTRATPDHLFLVITQPQNISIGPVCHLGHPSESIQVWTRSPEHLSSCMIVGTRRQDTRRTFVQYTHHYRYANPHFMPTYLSPNPLSSNSSAVTRCLS
jgi:hypothetical protein